MNVAILVDGAFYLNRAKKIWDNKTPSEAADILHHYCCAHVDRARQDNDAAQLYRIFFYDCEPADITAQNPISNKQISYKHSIESKWRFAFHDELRKKRKTALRLGKIDNNNKNWILDGDKLKKLLNGKITVNDLEENDINLELRQKGVDMKLGLDISSLSYKKQVQQIVLITGDSDFVPAAKLARREGIDFILDSMWRNVKPELFEHIDGRRSMIRRPKQDGSFSGEILTYRQMNFTTKGKKIKAKKK